MIKKLKELYNCEYDTEIKDIKINSKEVKPGDIFVCTKGVTADRHDFIDDAIKNGASALVVSKDVKVNIPTIKVENTNEELPKLSARFYNHPERNLKLIGITGTDGKTTTATMRRLPIRLQIHHYYINFYIILNRQDVNMLRWKHLVKHFIEID